MMPVQTLSLPVHDESRRHRDNPRSDGGSARRAHANACLIRAADGISRHVAPRLVRARNFPGSGMSDTHRPVYWLAGPRADVRLPRMVPVAAADWLPGHTLAAHSCRDSPVRGVTPFAAFPLNPFGHRCVSRETQTDSRRRTC